MRVLIAPDDFTGTLSASQAAQAMAAGWRSVAPGDDLVLRPLSDGGPGFVSVIAEGLGLSLTPVIVRGPLGEVVPAAIVVHGRTAYVESALACGLHLVPGDERQPLRASTVGVGELIAAALDAGARTVVIGLGGSGTTDGGAGMLAALGAAAVDDAGGPVDLRSGGAGLLDARRVDVARVRERLSAVRVVAASDVDSPLLGPQGAARGFAPQKGAVPDEVDVLEDALASWAHACGAPDLAGAPGAGAAGGLGFGLLLLGAQRVAGIDVVREAIGLTEAIASCDLVLTGEGCFDWQSLRGKVVSGLAETCLQSGRPLIVIAGRVEVGRREYAALGIAEARAVGPDPGPADALARATAQVAAQWSR